MYLSALVVEPVICPACQQLEAVYRHGKTTDGTKSYRYTACRRTFQLCYRHYVHEQGVRAKITDLALNGSEIRDTARVLGISSQTVIGEPKKIEAVSQHPQIHPTYALESGTALRLCADEMWSFVRCKKAQRWLWWVEDASTGQVVAFVFGR